MSDSHLQDTNSWIHEGWRFAGQGQWEEARICFDEALAIEPQNARALHSKGLCLAALGSLEEAIVCYDQAVVNDSGLTVVWFSKALVEEQIGRTRDAANSYQRFMALASGEDGQQMTYARRRLGELGIGGDGPVDSTPSPEPVPSAPAPRHPPQASSARGGAQSEGDSFLTFGINPRSRTSTRDTEDAATVQSRGLSLAALGCLEDAIDCYNEALSLDPHLTVTWFSKALAEERIGRTRDAANSYYRFMIVALDREQIAYVQGRLNELGFADEVQASLLASPDPARAIPPLLLQEAAVWVGEARRLAELERHQEACACYNRALAFDPQDAMTWQWKAGCLIALHRLKEAVLCLDRSLVLNPQDVGAWYFKGMILSILGQTEEVLACFDHVLVLNPKDAAACSNRANCLVALCRLEEALSSFDEMLALEPRHADALHNKGRCLAELGRPGQAIICYEQAIVLEPRKAAAWYDKALAEDQIARIGDAKSSYQRFLRVAPEDDEDQIAYARSRLQWLGPDPEGAGDSSALPHPVSPGVRQLTLRKPHPRRLQGHPKSLVCWADRSPILTERSPCSACAIQQRGTMRVS